MEKQAVSAAKREAPVKEKAPEVSAVQPEAAEAAAEKPGPAKRGRPRKSPEPKPASSEAEQEAPKAKGTASKRKSAPKDAPEAPAQTVAIQAETSAVPAEAPATPAEETAARQPARPAYQRPMSTQQRMGARTQPPQGSHRPQPRPAPANRSPRFSAEGAPARTPRSFESAPGFRRSAGEHRRPVPPQASEPQTAVEAPRPAAPVEDAAPAEERPVSTAVSEMIASGDFGDGAGILEIHSDGYGFLRAENYLPGNRDVYVSAAQIRRFNLRTGDYVVGKTRPQQMGDRSVGLIYISEVNGQSPDMARNRRPFDSLVPVYPDERLRMERPGVKDISLRIIDMIVPIGKGQRGMIVSQPKAGKTTLLKKIANAITANNPDVHLIVLLIDERPEEVTDMKRSIQGEVVYSTFDEAPENHTRVSEMVLERAQRLVELGKDVVVLLDSITRLARAYNLVIPPTGRSLSGGLDPGALYKPKRFFGAARNIENGGSLTIIATALVDTGSRMDDIIFEEFKGTGNMELHLDRSLSDRRIFPAIDMYRSSTRREELLLTKEELDGVYQVRRMLSKGNAQEAAEQLISLIEKTKTNEEFFQRFKGWINVYEREGFKM